MTPVTIMIALSILFVPTMFLLSAAYRQQSRQIAWCKAESARLFEESVNRCDARIAEKYGTTVEHVRLVLDGSPEEWAAYKATEDANSLAAYEAAAFVDDVE